MPLCSVTCSHWLPFQLCHPDFTAGNKGIYSCLASKLSRYESVLYPPSKHKDPKVPRLLHVPELSITTIRAQTIQRQQFHLPFSDLMSYQPTQWNSPLKGKQNTWSYFSGLAMIKAVVDLVEGNPNFKQAAAQSTMTQCLCQHSLSYF